MAQGPKGEGIICNDCATEWNRLETLRKQDQKRPDSQATEMKPDDDAPKRHSLIWISTDDDDIDEVEELQYIRPSTVVAMSSPAFDQSCSHVYVFVRSLPGFLLQVRFILLYHVRFSDMLFKLVLSLKTTTRGLRVLAGHFKKALKSWAGSMRF